jgi:hypothetical protein
MRHFGMGDQIEGKPFCFSLGPIWVAVSGISMVKIKSLVMEDKMGKNNNIIK